MNVPAIERVAPALPRGAEVIGRDAGNDARATVGAQIEQRLMHPDIGAMCGNKNGHVADDANAAFIGILLDRAPLAVETPLAEFPEIAFAGQHLRGFLQGIGVSQRQRRGPILPKLALAAVLLIERHEQRVIVQP